MLRCGVALLILPASLRAFINPAFTPADLVSQSRSVLTGRLRHAGEQTWHVTSPQAIKGTAPRETRLSLAKCRETDREPAARLLAAGETQAVVLFRGEEEDPKRAYLHAGGQWLAAGSADGLLWSVSGLDRRMSGVYAGATDMLVRMTRYLLQTPGARVPVSVGMCWVPERYPLGEFAGPVCGMGCVTFGPGTAPCVFVGSEAGDRLFRPREDREGFIDITLDARVRTRSRRFVWADLNRDGRPDLASWDGVSLTVHPLGADGVLSRQPALPSVPLDGTCLGLTACGSPSDGEPALLVSMQEGPVLVTWGARAGPSLRPLQPRATSGAGPASAAPCLAVDLDMDGAWDVLHPRPQGAVLWRGVHGLEQAETTDVVCGTGEVRPTYGDFDQDGDLDLLLADSVSIELWENDGHARFRKVTPGSGSLAYKAPGGVAACLATDLNHDGAVDICLLYGDGNFMYHFNRGFRCFGEEGGLRLTDVEGAEPTPVGQVAAVTGDYNRDGSLDLVVAFADGRVYAYYNELFERPALRVTVDRALPGPLTLSVWQGDPFPVCVGAGTVGGLAPSPAVFPLRDRTSCTLRWCHPRGEHRKRTASFSEAAGGPNLEVLIGN